MLVFNPRIPYTKKDGTKTFHLVGLKLEDRGIVPTIKSKSAMVSLLESVGGIQVVSGDDNIYRVEIEGVGARGARKSVYNKIKRYLQTYTVYRTYDYKEARKSQVFLEPITLPKPLVEVLIEN